MLAHYAAVLHAVELNNTFYARPTVARVRSWLAATPPDFRFVVKAQRGGTMRALGTTPAESAAWLTERLPEFGDRLGAVLLTVPANLHRPDDDSGDRRLRDLLAAWPVGIPLVLELAHPSWHVDEALDLLRETGVTLVATEGPEDEVPPTIRLTGRMLYLRLRRHDYAAREIEAWAARVAPFLDAGHNTFAFFRHDETGRATELARSLAEAVGRLVPAAVR